MYIIFLILTMLKVALACIQQKSNPSFSRIVGGEETTIEEHPHQVAIRVLFSRPVYGRHNCGGSLIKLNVVLTAAHCMALPLEQYSVKAGSKFTANSEEVLPIRRYLNHPHFDGVTLDYDVSLIELDGSFQESSKIKIIQILPDGKTIPVGEMATVTGWGRTLIKGDNGESAPKILRKVKVRKYKHTRCRSIHSKFGSPITDRMTCYGAIKGSKGSCHGDSGGPLVAKTYLIGIVSWGIPCAQSDVPDVYTDLRNKEIRNFIFSNWE